VLQGGENPICSAVTGETRVFKPGAVPPLNSGFFVPDNNSVSLVTDDDIHRPPVTGEDSGTNRAVSVFVRLGHFLPLSPVCCLPDNTDSAPTNKHSQEHSNNVTRLLPNIGNRQS
jgi:hypothetical protein